MLTHEFTTVGDRWVGSQGTARQEEVHGCNTSSTPTEAEQASGITTEADRPPCQRHKPVYYAGKPLVF